MQKLASYIIKDEIVDIYQSVDYECTYLEQIKTLWKEVYIDEMKHPVKLENGNYPYKCDGGLLFFGIKNDQCIGTIKTKHDSFGDLEFDYSSLMVYDHIFEVSKLIIDMGYRSTQLLRILMMHTQFYCNANYPYNYIVINSTPRLEIFYSRIGFRKISDKVLIHPVYCNESILLACSNDLFQQNAIEFQKQINTLKYELH